MKVVSLSFGSPVSAYSVSNIIFDIKATEDKTKIYTPMLSVLVKNLLSFGSLYAGALPKISGGGFSE